MSLSDLAMRLMAHPPDEPVDQAKMAILSRWRSWFSCDDAIRETARSAAFIKNASGDLNDYARADATSWLLGRRIGDALHSPLRAYFDECSVDALSIVAIQIINLHDPTHLERLRRVNDRLFQIKTPPDPDVLRVEAIERRIARSMLEVITNEIVRLHTSAARNESLIIVASFLSLSELRRRQMEYVPLLSDTIGQQSPSAYRFALRA